MNPDRPVDGDDRSQVSGHSQLLTIVARGTAIITEIYRLVELIPEPFQRKLAGKKKQHTELDEIVFNFSYFRDAEEIEARIERQPQLRRADELFCDHHTEILTRFYLTFESVDRYATDLNRFILDLEDGLHIGQTLETFLLNTENLQLLCEAHFQLGYMLLLVDLSFHGDLRERLIVSYYRYSSYKSSPGTGLDGTCNLMRDTHFVCEHQKSYNDLAQQQQAHHRPANYPESYFARADVDRTVVNMLIAKLQIVDIYNKTIAAFPHPEHRSNALSQQASMLYVLLYFCPDILNSQRSRMREIADKFFSDNWVIDVFMGERVNLIEAWDPYRAAKESLIHIHDMESVSNLSNQMAVKFNSLARQISGQYLVEGWLNEETFLDNNIKILNCIRDSNVILRWIALHLSMRPCWRPYKLIKSLQSIVVAIMPSKRHLCEFLQRLAVLEKRVNLLHDEAIGVKLVRVEDNKARAGETLNELIAIFNDSVPLRWVKVGANTSLANILSDAYQELMTMDLAASPKARDPVIKLINRIEAARETYSNDKSLQVVQLFADTKQSLLKILKNIDLDSNLKIILQSVGDFSYAWRLMDELFTEHLQQTIKDDPFSMFGLEAIIIKLSAAFETQLLRIQQVGSSADLVSVSQYYSTKLVAYIRDVLQVIPATIFELIGSIITIQTDNIIGSMPSKIPLDHLKDYCLSDQRFKMLELTSKISDYAKGIMTMPRTAIGLVRLDSKQLLEDGMRSELVKRMSDSIQSTLQFQEAPGGDSHHSPITIIQAAQLMEQKLKTLAAIINGYKRSLEYIQDFLFIYGLRMWQEELARIIKSNFEQANTAIIEATNLSQSSDTASVSSRMTVQSQAASVGSAQRHPLMVSKQQFDWRHPTGEGGCLQSSSFIIRLLNELLKMTSPRETVYDEQTNAWYEQKGSHRQVLDARIFQLIHSSLGATGMNCLDRLCCTLIMLELQRLNVFILELTLPTSTTGPSRSEPNPKTLGLLETLKFVKELRDNRTPNQWNANKTAAAAAAAGQYRQSMSRAFSSCLSKFGPFSERLVKHLLSIGQLQAIRLSISCALTKNCRYEARHLYACLSALNSTLLAALKHGKQRQKEPPETEASKEKLKGAPDSLTSDSPSHLYGNLEDSQLVFELTNHLEWIGLSDPMSKIYTLELQQRLADANSCQQPCESVQTDRCKSCLQSVDHTIPVSLVYLLLIEYSSRFSFSQSLSGLLPKQAKSFYDTSSNVDALPLFYGITTLLNHYQPGFEIDSDESAPTSAECARCRSGPVGDLIGLMSIYVESLLGHPLDGATIKPNELTLEVANMVVSIIELSRQARIELSSESGPEDRASRFCLPKYILDTFQITYCNRNSNLSNC